MGCAFFNFTPPACKSDDVWYIIRIRRIKYRFMRVTSQILDTTLEILKTRKLRCHILDSQVSGCVANVNSDHIKTFLYPEKSISKCTIILYFCLTKWVSCWVKYSHELLLICGVYLKSCINFSKISIFKLFIY